MGFIENLKHGYNAFRDQKNVFKQNAFFQDTGGSVMPQRPNQGRRQLAGNDKTLLSSIYNTIGVDVALAILKHVKLDDNERYVSTVRSGLNYCLTRKANIDQDAQAFRLDMALTLLQEGHIAVIPVDTTVDPETGSYDIKTLRVGTIVRWFPRHVRVRAWDDTEGKYSEVVVSKELVAIAVNPFFDVMNAQNSTLQRLSRKLNLLDVIDEQAGSGKLDIIVQLPYVIKTDAKAEQAKKRQKELEFQLTDSKYGIAYMDATEKITQLNRPAENNMLGAVEYLTERLFNELGMTPEILNGTASEAVMLNYQNRTVLPILNAIKEALVNAFLTKTAITQGHSIEFYRDAFSLVPLSSIADIADKLGRNEVLSSNEIRGILGFAPSKDPNADKLRNSNMPQPKEEPTDLGELKPVAKPDANQPAIEQRKT